MSMDETFIQIQQFERTLRSFNDDLKSSLDELNAQHEYVSPYWQDEMRKHYDAVWKPFYGEMLFYVAVEGPSYVEFLNIKIHALRRYLQGG